MIINHFNALNQLFFILKETPEGDITLDNTELLLLHHICAVMMYDLESTNICENLWKA